MAMRVVARVMVSGDEAPVCGLSARYAHLSRERLFDAVEAVPVMGSSGSDAAEPTRFVRHQSLVLIVHNSLINR